MTSLFCWRFFVVAGRGIIPRPKHWYEITNDTFFVLLALMLFCNFIQTFRQGCKPRRAMELALFFIMCYYDVRVLF